MTNPVPEQLPITFAEAEELSPYELARRWADRTSWPLRVPAEVARKLDLPEATAHGELQELATMAAIGRWMERWLPIQIHRAAQLGANVEQIAAAAGMTEAQARERWQAWADEQTSVVIDGRPLLDRDEAAKVRARLNAPSRTDTSTTEAGPAGRGADERADGW